MRDRTAQINFAHSPAVSGLCRNRHSEAKPKNLVFVSGKKMRSFALPDCVKTHSEPFDGA